MIEVEDRLEIQDLISMYSYAYDENLIDEFMSLFADDAEVDLLTYSKGLDEIRGQIEERRHYLRNNGIHPRHHQTVTVLKDISDTRVQGKTYILLTWYREDASELELRFSGMYDDEFVKTDSGWKFRKRKVERTPK